jgi:hypothetical protein
LGERLLCKQEVIGSIPFTSTDRMTEIGDRFGPLGSGPLGSGPLGSGPLGSGPLGSGRWVLTCDLGHWHSEKIWVSFRGAGRGRAGGFPRRRPRHRGGWCLIG